MQQYLLRLKGRIQHYAWGGDTFIPDLVGVSKDQPPYAEYWMGAHPGASSLVEWEGRMESLNGLIARDPATFIGSYVHERFGELPYLFKVLDVKQMLSIQVHPSKKAAIEAFAQEEKAGIPLHAPHRNYKDKNHKPEVMIALSEFWLLHGFREQSSLAKILEDTAQLRFLKPIFEKEGYAGLYSHVMGLSQEEADRILAPLVKVSQASPTTDKQQPAYWVHKLYADNTTLTGLDRGIFSIFFFNIVHLETGQGIFQAAGVPHAYLEGQNMELMANSDNVLRGGLTPKHIDVPELMKHIVFEATKPDILEGQPVDGFEKIYPCPVPDFGITAISLPAGRRFCDRAFSGEIFFVYQGAIRLGEGDERYQRGASFYALPGSEVVFHSEKETLIYRAFVPSEK